MQLGERKLLNGFCTYLHKSSVVVTITIIIIIIAVIVVQLTSIGH